MKRQKNIIRKISGKSPYLNRHIAEIEGLSSYRTPDYYINTQNGDEYYSIILALAWPGKIDPGCLVVVAVDKTDDPEPPFRVLQECEDSNIEGLLRKGAEFREKYGYRQYGLLKLFYGDFEKFQSIVAKVNNQLERETQPGNRIILTPPTDFESPNSFEIYARQVQACLTKDDSGKKRLNLDARNILINRLQNFPPDGAAKGSAANHPAVAALGYAVHTLVTNKPWERGPGGPVRLFPTIFED